MVKVYGPAMSLTASGTLANTLTYSSWKGRAYVRERVIPSNPKSGLQTGFRSMFKFLSQQWATVPGAKQATWQTLADASVISPFNAYMAQNQLRWRRFLPPSFEYPIPAIDSVGTYTAGEPTATGGIASVTITHTIDLDIEGNWGLLIFKSTTGFSTGVSNLVAAILSDTLSTEYTWLDSPLSAATYYYNCRLFTNDGVLGPELGEISAAAS